MDDSNYNELKKQQAKAFLDSMVGNMKSKFEYYRKLNYNPNTKGFNFEKTLCSLLKDYLGSKYEFHTRASLIDKEMDYIKILSDKSNEIDVVGTFKNAIPKIVCKIDDTNFLPYDSIAFIVEVKSSLTKANLESDIEKLRKVSKLELDKDRFGNFVLANPKFIQRPLRFLFYYELNMQYKILESILEQNSEVWDAVYILRNPENKDEIAINKSLPLVAEMCRETDRMRFGSGEIPKDIQDQKFRWWEDVPFIIWLYVIHGSIPSPISVDVMSTFVNIAKFAHMK